MKKLFIIFAFLTIGLSGFAQTSFEGFFRPLDRSLFQPTVRDGVKVRATTNLWLFRPVVTLSAMQFMLTNPVQVSSLSSFGTGVSYQNIVNENDAPYTRFGVNALVLFTQKIGDVEPASLSFAATLQTLQFVNIGAGYSLGQKKFFILTSVSYNFN